MGFYKSSERLQKELSSLKNSVARERLIKLFDQDSFNELDALSEAAQAVIGCGLINGMPCCAFSQDINVSGGAVGQAQAKKMRKAYEYSLMNGMPLIGIFDSKGAYLDEGVDAMAAYGELLLNANNLSGVVPQISIIAGACAGTAALIASSGDIVIHVDSAPYYLNSKDKDEQLGSTHIRAKDEDDAIERAREILSYLPANNLSETAGFDAVAPADADYTNTDDMIGKVSDASSFIELQADFGENVTCGLGLLNGVSVAFLETKGGMLDCNAAAKAARFVRFADAFSVPVVTFVDAQGFESISDAAKLAHAYAEATTAKIAVITGEAIGSAYIAMAGRGANADYVAALDTAVVSALPVESAVAVMWNDRLNALENPLTERAGLIEEYKMTDGSAFEAARRGYVEDIAALGDIRKKIIDALGLLSSKRVATLPKKHSNIQL
ncbi:MAG: carboxyl transferase [Clostridia bacterium]|nr:carboxyl transferase [Clostridia bacterium]